MTELVIAMFWAMTVQAQESQDSIESVNKLVALQEVVIKGGLPNTRLKAGAMVRLSQAHWARCSSRCQV